MVVKLSNCKRCGSPFLKEYRETCPTCFEVEYDQVQKICNYVEPKTSVSIYEISSCTDIDLKYIEYYLKKGRLSRIIKKLSVNCKVCGTHICDVTKEGFMCDKCVKEIGKDPRNRNSINNFDKKLQRTKVQLKNFDKDIMHINKEEEASKRKYGFKKNYDL